MILVDTAVWIDHLRWGNAIAATALAHPARLWTIDHKLARVASDLGLAA
jgi:predicted nucleic acid-binding protein